MPMTRMSRTLATVAGLCAVGVLAVTPAFAHGRPVRAAHRASATIHIRLETVHMKGKTLKVLATAQGDTLYFVDGATVKKDAVVGKFAKIWPPLLAPKGAKIVAPKGMTGFTVALSAGRSQVIFRGHPLFRFFEDKKPGEALGQGFKKIWWAATPALKGVGAVDPPAKKSKSSGW